MQTRQILTAGLSLAVLGDVLFRAAPGINFLLWLVLLLSWTARTSRISPFHSGLAVPILFFAGCIAWRDSSFLTLANTTAVLGLLTLPFTQHAGVVLRCGTISAYVRGVRRTFGSLWINTARFLTADVPETFAASRAYRLSRPVAIGLAAAVPVGIVFLILFASADPAFAQAVQTVFQADPADVFSHAFFAACIGLASIGYLHGLAQPGERPSSATSTTHLNGFGIIEIAIPLTTLILIFGAFLAFQLPYFFGGLSVVEGTRGLNFATYARKGFFELTTASALVVPVLLTADRLLTSNTRDRKIFHRLAAIQIVLVGVLMISALQRMGLYWQAYGLTTTRVYATAFMVWIGTVLAWFTVTVLRRRRKRFAFGAMVSGLCVLAALNFMNPDSVIARLNLARGVDNFDWDYASHLSADAAVPLLKGLRVAPEADRCYAAHLLSSGWNDPHADWRSWNIARYRARAAAQRMTSSLDSYCDQYSSQAPP